MSLLQEVEKVSITILMDNSTDFLLTSSAHAVRPSLIVNEKFNLPPPVAEHGFSALVNVVSKYVQIKGEKIIVLMNIRLLRIAVVVAIHFSLIQE
jgi:septum formation topological specificity factor MinE